jgi:mono/diheme cytochrome c family protein
MNDPKYSVLVAAFALVATAPATDDEIPFPEGYRNWMHIRSAVVGPTSSGFQRFGGMHSIYANTVAMEGYRTGKFPSGSVIVFDNHETLTFQGAELAGKRRFVDVMAKTGGSWRFGEFAGDSKALRNVTVAQGQTQCAACHSKSPTDHVYSQFDP